MSACSRWLGVFVAWAAVGCVDEGPPFTLCEGANECAPPADGCYRVTITRSDGSEATGRQCTLECPGGDADCPGDSPCLVLEGDETETPLCFARCEVAEDCYVGLRCTAVTGAGSEVTSVCLP